MASRPIPARRSQPPGMTPGRLRELMAARLPGYGSTPQVDPVADDFPAEPWLDPEAASLVAARLTVQHEAATVE